MSAGISVPGGTGGNGISGRKKGKALPTDPLFKQNMIPGAVPIGYQPPKPAKARPAKPTPGSFYIDDK